MTRVEGGEGNWGRWQKGKGGQGIHIKDPWTNPKRVGSRVGGGEGWGGGEWWGKVETTVLENQFFKKAEE